jgi:NTP pyrophosphatase (non-canonical NTP hydrolase)
VNLAEIQRMAHANARAKGFHEHAPRFGQPGRDTRHILSWLMLVVTELAEAAEEVRLGDKEKFAEECADTLIRLADLCEALGIDLEAETIKKMARNAERPAMHGGKLA